MLKHLLDTCSMIAVLRGIRPDEVEAIGGILYEAGFRLIEIPLNSPEPFESIRLLRQVLPEDCHVGAGTALTVTHVQQARAAGAEMIVMPHTDTILLQECRAAGMTSVAGVATLTEAFHALNAGADILKMFPSDLVTPGILRAWRSVIPAHVPLAPFGHVTPDMLPELHAAGATAFGLDTSLYSPGMTATQVHARAMQFMSAWRALHAETVPG